MSISLQDQYGSQGVCFGCGPTNSEGLHIKSYVDGDQIVATWLPKPGYEGFEGMMNGGIIASLMDCHSNWAAAWFLMQERGLDRPMSTVTGKFSIQFLAPTPTDTPVHITAKLAELKDYGAVIESEMKSGGMVTAQFTGTFIAVKPDHPAYNQWTTGNGRKSR